MIEFRWVKVGMDHKNYNDSVVREVYHFDGPPLEIHTEDVVLQWRVGVHMIATKEDIWEDWQTVEFDPNVEL